MTEISDAACERLFKAVVNQALEDACLVVPEALPKSPPPDFVPAKRYGGDAAGAWADKRRDRVAKIRDIRRTRDEARTWLEGGSADFRRVCSFAGYEPEYIERAVVILKSNGWSVKDDAKQAA